ncbi:MAG TPA: nitronate monooxygenase family protein [Candidatus Binatus sp.]|uniref:nitronate monooxygenase n=1 Tax=Candidatus Binatus sp. TaxID=2811406 RepID=UPI002B4A0454|nr:nitronate monooxygenase family protein [Candidatus Binatus sp.]HKN13838.1 nitronate monooxygenase family protein [Candidatus Binatus sp.]
MKTPICKMLGIDFPLLAFSHCRDVVAAVSRAGGFGVLGATGFTLDQLELELKWIDDHIDGKPYGIDVLIPENLSIRYDKSVTTRSLVEHIPQQHKDFVRELLSRSGIEPSQAIEEGRVRSPDAPVPFQPEYALKLLELAFHHPIKLIANALGVPPQAMIDMGRQHGVPVAALVGAPEHAVRQVKAGVDIIVAQGGEAGGHCGEVSTIVLIPEVLRAIKPIRDVPVLAAGGIMTGRQMAACMAMGAAGAWTGSVWLATTESETSEIFREKMIEARSRDTIRSKGRTGKPSRQLRSTWTDAWEGPGSPGALPMPLQSLISEPALHAADLAAERGNAKAREMVTYFVGQGVGLVDSVKSTRAVVKEFMEEFVEAVSDLQALMED